MTHPDPSPTAEGLTGRPWWIGCALALTIALGATVPTTGDIGLTWDEPSYRTSQLVSAHWWEGLRDARSRADVEALTSADALLFYWPYARFGYNFHPPLAGQLNLLTHALFGGWMKDIPARRLASVFEYSATIALLFGFLARRYGAWVGGVASGSLLLMPRVYGDGHIAGTDTPGLLLWAATALAFWKGLHEPKARGWRVLVGICLGLGFVEKMAAVAVLGPILAWLVVARLPRTFRRGGRADWVDGLATSAAMLLPIGLAFAEVLRLARAFPTPDRTDLFLMRPTSRWPGAILMVPLVVWFARRGLGRLYRGHPVWGVERPALEVWTAILAFAPAVGWLGNPGWWRETMPRMAHYYQLNADRRGALPDIRILYAGEIYTYSLPWPNAWVLIAITVPAGILMASMVGLGWGLMKSRRGHDLIPMYFALHLAFLPALRMLPTPGHDGVRLFLPTFFFLAAFAGWGTVAMGDGLARWVKRRAAARGLVAALVLGTAAWQLVAIHPYELSYYNEMMGGARGARESGFELSYWYEAFDGPTLRDLNQRLPDGASVDFLNRLVNTPSLGCLQELGHLKGSIHLGADDPDRFPYGWMLTHDSKAIPLTRLLFAMTPFYASSPAQLGGLRVVTVASPEAVARAWALDVLTRGHAEPERVKAPAWVPGPLRRFRGEGVTRGPTLAVDESIFDWAKADPDALRSAAKAVASGKAIEPGSAAARLRAFLAREHPDKQGEPVEWASRVLIRNRPEALVEAVEILIRRPEEVRSVLLRPGFSDVEEARGFLDRETAR